MELVWLGVAAWWAFMAAVAVALIVYHRKQARASKALLDALDAQIYGVRASIADSLRMVAASKFIEHAPDPLPMYPCDGEDV